MQFFEGIVAIILSTFLLILIMIISQNIKAEFKKLEEVETDLALENGLARITFQKLSNTEALLNEVIGILDSNGIKWVNIEISSENNGRISVWNTETSNHRDERNIKRVKAIRVNGDDVLRIVVSIEDD